jgi:hypothetical protein
MDNSRVTQANNQLSINTTTNREEKAEKVEEFTRRDFVKALEKVSRRRASPPDEGTSGT